MDKSLYLHPARKKRMRRPEQHIQIAVMSHLIPLMKYRDFLVWHTPSGARLTATQAGIMKAMGTMAGIPDLIFLFPDSRMAFVEFKVRTLKKGGKWTETKTSPEQNTFMIKAEGLGFDCWTVAAKDVTEALTDVLGIMKSYGIEDGIS